jgi:hypothetical protein
MVFAYLADLINIILKEELKQMKNVMLTKNKKQKKEK